MTKTFFRWAAASVLIFDAPAMALAQSADVASETPAIVAAAPAPEATSPSRAAAQRGAFRKPSERVEARLAYLRTALKITDAQQPQWETFAEVLRKHARDMDQRMEQRFAARQAGASAAVRSTNAIERLERAQQRAALRSTRLNEVIVAARPLYAAFSPEQKQIADEMLARRDGRGAHHRHHRRGDRGA